MSAKLPSGIDRLPSGKYRVRVPLEKVDGRWRYGGGTFTRIKDAEARRQALIVAKQTGRVDLIDADLITLAELAAEHMQATQATLAANTYSTYRDLWMAHVVGRNGQGRHAIADMTLRAITATTVEKFAADRLDAGAGPEAIRKLLALMHTVFNRAVRDRRIDRNPVALVKRPPAKPRTRIVPTTPEEVEKLRTKLPVADAVLVAILAYTGMRPGEARGLQWSDLSDRNIHVWRSVGPGGVKGTKTTKTRSVPLCAALKADLAAWKRQLGPRSPESFILPRADGEPWTDDDFKNWQKRRFKTAVKAAQISLARPYDLRHSAASLWIAEGRNVVEVAAWLGHQPTETLKTYAHVVADRDPSDKRTVDERIAAARRDISVTYERGKAGQPAVRRKTRKRRQKACLGTSA